MKRETQRTFNKIKMLRTKLSHEAKGHKKEEKYNCLIIITKSWIIDERDWSYTTTSNVTVLQSPAG